MSKMSNLALEQEDNNEYWINRCYDLEQKYQNLLREIGDMLASVIVQEMEVQK